MMMIFKERERERESVVVVVVVVNASLQRSPPGRSYEIVVVLKVARFCARACVLCISTDESRNL
jgi:hypothetical protein